MVWDFLDSHKLHRLQALLFIRVQANGNTQMLMTPTHTHPAQIQQLYTHMSNNFKFAQLTSIICRRSHIERCVFVMLYTWLYITTNIISCKRIFSFNTARTKSYRGWSRFQGCNPEVVTSALEQTKQNPEPSVGPLTNPDEAWQCFLCFIINANVITVTLTVGRAVHQHLWHLKMNAAIHHYTGLMEPKRLNY